MSTEPELDVPLEDPNQEAEAQYLIHQIIMPGQRLCAIMGEDKKAWPLAWLHDPTSARCRNFIRKHVLNAPATFLARFVEKPDEISSHSVDHLCLGAYYGGTETLIGDGQNKTSSFALDVDKTDCENAILAALPDKIARDDRRAQTKSDPVWQKAETARLDEMLAEARRVFPAMRFFRKANGRFHGHANLNSPLDALLVKKWARSKLPPMLQHVEIFPKCADDADLSGYYAANQVRLPFNPTCAYEPLDGLADIEPYNTAQIVAEAPTLAPQAEAPLGLDDLEREFKQPIYCFTAKSDRIRRYAEYLKKYPPAVSGDRGHDRLLLACAHRFGFGVTRKDALSPLREYSQTCEPPWSDDEIRHKLKDAKPTEHFEPGSKLMQADESETTPSKDDGCQPKTERRHPEQETLPDFPVDVFRADDIPRLIHSIAWVTQTPPDLAAQTCLSVVALAASRAGIFVEWRPGVIEPTNLYLLTVLSPSEHKSSAMKKIVECLRDFEKDAMVAAAKKKASFEFQLAVLEEKISKARRANSVDLQSLIEQKLELTEPVRPRYILDDVTPETFNSIIAGNKALGIISSEASIIDNMSGRYSKSGEGQIGPYLKTWDGEPYSVDRRDRSELISGLLTIGCTCQPAALLRMVDVVKGARGLGLLSRFLFSRPQSRVGFRSTDDDPLDSAALEAWKRRVGKILHMKPTVLKLSVQARELLRQWRGEIERRMRRDLRIIEDWAGKVQAGQVVRLAGLLHVCREDARGEISAETMRDAIRLGRYYIANAIKVFESIEDGPHAEMAEKIEKWIESSDEDSRKFTLRQVAQKFRKENDEIEPVLNWMVNVGKCEPLPDEAKTKRQKVYMLTTAPAAALTPLARPEPATVQNVLPIASDSDAVAPSSPPAIVNAMPEDFDDPLSPCATDELHEPKEWKENSFGDKVVIEPSVKIDPAEFAEL